MSTRPGLLLGPLLLLERALPGLDTQVVANPHREPVREQVGQPDDDDDTRGERPAGHTGHDREGGQNAVVGAIDEIPHVVLRGLVDTSRVDVFRSTPTCRA